MATSDSMAAMESSCTMVVTGEVCSMSPSGNLFWLFLFGRSGNVCFVCLAYFILHLPSTMMDPCSFLQFFSFIFSSYFLFSALRSSISQSPPLFPIHDEHSESSWPGSEQEPLGGFP